MTTTRHPRLLGLAACLLLGGLLMGLPLVLLALGWSGLPAGVDGWLTALSRPDDGHLTVLVLQLVAWVVWGLLAISILTEIVAAVRHVKAPRLPALSWSQIPARKLVAAAMLLFVAVPAAGASTGMTHGPAATSAPVATAVTHSAPVALDRSVSLNRATLPAATQALSTTVTSEARSYTVVQGDTLSGIALKQLGHANAWPQIFEASRHLTQPGGRHLTNPNVILPGWHLLIPTTATQTPSSAATTATATTSASPVAPAPVSESSGVSSASAPAPAASVAPAAPLDIPTPSASSTVAPTGQSSSAGATTAASTTMDAVPDAATSTEEQPQAPWLLVGLSGAGAMLAGGLVVALRRRRRAQFRARHPGRAILAPPVELLPVEKTLLTTGAGMVPTIDALDRVLKLLGTQAGPVPQLLAVHLQRTGMLEVHLAEPVELDGPWQPAAPDRRRWVIQADQAPLSGSRAPWPQLVTIGQDEVGTWLVNLEQLGTVSLTGDPTFGADFARYVAAEIAVNPWSTQVHLDCVGIAAEAAPLAPARIRHYRLDDPAGLHEAITHADVAAERSRTLGAPVATGRASDLGEELWPSRLVLVNGALNTPSLTQLLASVEEHPGRTATAVVMVADSDPVRGVTVQLTGHGRVRVPTLGLDLVAVGLTPDEATGCALLLAQADLVADSSMPAAGEEGWRGNVDAAGALLDALVLPRETDPATLTEPVSTIVATPDDQVLAVTAATVEDLQQLAPLVPDTTGVQVAVADPDLDADLAVWSEGSRPTLRLLGPIQARTGATGNPTTVAKRKAFYTELLAFLALHPEGVTTDQLVDAFAVDGAQIRVHVSKLRNWLGVDPDTGSPYLPEATKSPAAIARGMGLYQLVGVLTDVDLFRRLRARSQTRGPAGLADLQAALHLVTGEPFTGQRRGGWSWLAEGARIDQVMVCAIVDVAHLVTMATLSGHRLSEARTATEAALLAAPYEDTPRLDLAAISAAEGDQRAAQRIVHEDVYNRTEDGEAPEDLSERTTAIVTEAAWLEKVRVA